MQGETLGIIGRNGAGKSTLLRVMAEIIAPDVGEVRNYAGRASIFSLQVGFIPHLVGRENALFSSILLGLTRKEAKAKLNSIIEYSGLGDFIDEPTCNYSSGMAARLGFSIAYHADPPILLIDEVLGVGDVEFMEQSTKAMRDRINSDRTVVIVSHNMKMIEELSTRVLWIDHGVSKALGDPHVVISEYIRAVAKCVHK
ncbi:MAG: ABC transporter ATP-binding protein [Desulfovibrio aminophilus]|uniref:ABC transporter ATP-binding protein n=1 Tax=Desulfovibrio aminophilus TaxID=81425 RepID=UPI0039E8DAC3